MQLQHDKKINRGFSKTSLIVLFILAIPTTIYLLLADTNILIRLFPDDAFYYLQTAFNTAQSGFISFDGINPTNGFHPLQFLISVLMALTDNKETVLKLAVVQNALLILLSGSLLSFYYLKNTPNRIRNIALLILSMPEWFLYLYLDVGMEMSLVLFFTVVFLINFEKIIRGTINKVQSVTLGIIVALLLLSRLDLVIPLVPFGIFFLYRIYVEKKLGQAIVSVLCILVFIVPYLSWNNMTFGHIVPISGLIKTNALHSFSTSWRSLSSGNLIGSLIILLPVIVLAFNYWLSIGKENSKVTLTLLVSVFIYYIYILFIAKQVFRWYLSYPIAAQIFAIANILGLFWKKIKLRMKKRTNWIKIVMLCLLVLNVATQALIYYGVSSLNTTSYQLKQIADSLNQNLPDGAIVATHDAGVLGYFCRVPVVNLDGLANSHDYYYNYMILGKYNEYFSKTGVTHLLLRTTLFKYDAQRKNYVSSLDPSLLLKHEQNPLTYSIEGQFSLRLFSLQNSFR
jgi:hypothetical protein